VVQPPLPFQGHLFIDREEILKISLEKVGTEFRIFSVFQALLGPLHFLPKHTRILFELEQSPSTYAGAF
jgi:hypothetical protein